MFLRRAMSVTKNKQGECMFRSAAPGSGDTPNCLPPPGWGPSGPSATVHFRRATRSTRLPASTLRATLRGADQPQLLRNVSRNRKSCVCTRAVCIGSTKCKQNISWRRVGSEEPNSKAGVAHRLRCRRRQCCCPEQGNHVIGGYRRCLTYASRAAAREVKKDFAR